MNGSRPSRNRERQHTDSAPVEEACQPAEAVEPSAAAAVADSKRVDVVAAAAASWPTAVAVDTAAVAVVVDDRWTSEPSAEQHH